jgi:hypothetical protein
MIVDPAHRADTRLIGRRLYVWHEPDVSIRQTARFCSLGPPPAASPISTPLESVTPGEPSERFPDVDLVARPRRDSHPGKFMTLEAELNHVISDFLTTIGDLARRAAIETLGAAFRNGSHSARIAVRAAVMPVGRPPGRGRPKRGANELSELSAKFAAFVRRNPGLRIEQINKQLGTTTKDLALPIRKLIADGTIKTKNKKRSTTYFPGAAAKAARA